MKPYKIKISSFIFCVFLTLSINSQSVLGAWERIETQDNGDKHKTVVTIAKNYQVATTFNEMTGKFIHTNGGSWKLKGDIMTEKVEFDSKDSTLIGKEISFKIVVTKNTLTIPGYNLEYKRIDAGLPGKLQGGWIMSGRIRNGKTQLRDTNRPRKTMKILSGTRFQWIAYNTETKEFKGTGGGTYTTKNGKYTESIEFFSKDNSRVGASLEFNYELKDDYWHHSGLSSKGKPIYEIWSIRK